MQVICDYCGKPARLINSSMVYNGRDYGMIYYCHGCEAWVGVHKGTDEPLGRLADAELRYWKRRAHAAFDPLWRGKEKRIRRWAYEWLAQEMGLPEEQTHIGMFDVEQCRQVIRICKEARKHELQEVQQPQGTEALQGAQGREAREDAEARGNLPAGAAHGGGLHADSR